MILQEIMKKRMEQLAKEKEAVPQEKIERVLKKRTDLPFRLRAALRQGDFHFIAEVKKASPSKGIIVPDFDPVTIARAYQMAGAAAISVVTENHYFQGSNEYMKEIYKYVTIPMIRKDFIVDPYQIWHSRYLGGSAVLLIVALLDQESLTTLLREAHALGLDAIVEVHNQEELDMAIKAKAKIIGINNRDLNTFEVDLNTTLDLMPLIPPDVIVISESGFLTKTDIDLVKASGVKNILIGEALVKSEDIRQTVKQLGL